MDYRCAVCQHVVSGDMMVYVDHTEKHVIELVKHDHPDWVEKDGICQKCLEYFRDELKGAPFHDVPCALRKRKITGIFDGIKTLFKKS